MYTGVDDMTLPERIRECRLNAGMSQEQLAEMMNVSRQAVTKWESGASSPSTENLFKLAEIFGTTVDLLINEHQENSLTIAKELFLLQQQDEERIRNKKKAERVKNGKLALLLLAGYLLVYLTGRILWCFSPSFTVMGWLFLSQPSGNGSYLFGWLLANKLFWIPLLMCIICSLLGKRVFSVNLFIFSLTGLLIGTLFSHYPAGIPYGHSEYGWAIWIIQFLLAFPVGIYLQRHPDKRNTRIPLLILSSAISVITVIILR